MKLLIVTDLHYWSDEEYQLTKDLYDYDICFLLGDILYRDLLKLKTIIHSPLYGLNGNHNFNDIEAAGIDSIHGKVINYNGLTFSGFQGSLRYKNGDYNMYSHKESIEICRNIPGADIFLTHDTLWDGLNNSHSGLQGINEYITLHKPKLHIHGHLHINNISTINHKKFSLFRKEPIKETVSIAVYKAAIIDTDTLEVNILY